MKFVLLFLCMLSFFPFSSLYAAASVRSFYGDGVYKSVSGASNGVTSSLRGGSVRVAPVAGKVNKDVGNNQIEKNAISARLSVGKYLGGGTTVSGGSSLKPQNPVSGSGGGVDTDLVAELQNDVDKVIRDVELLNEAADNYALKEDLTDKVNVTDVYSKEEIDDKLEGVSTGEIDLSEYAKKTDLENKLDVSSGAEQVLQGVYTVSGILYVPTPALP